MSQYGYTLAEKEQMRIERQAAVEREAEVKAAYRAGVERAVKEALDRAEFENWAREQLALCDEYEELLKKRAINTRFRSGDSNQKIMIRKGN